ncbi:hypothetical protein TEA_004323 [Camellia sinensis var. sinensis]|uniref:Uncharacterized protein n=1 Tax=Camellia sinensis var. sinensis TaxID=542762 RepID=A0A4S4DHV7_CAMSN|nr:hypothetical protein TEA_004323 [Camellia sinensis var. sinensis]
MLLWCFQLRYPDSCLEFKYDPTFPIRGLYYDKLKGCLLKLDFFGSIEPDGCYFGQRKFTKNEIEQIYGTRHIGRDQAHGLVSLMDFFCFSEACLIADIVQHFVDAKLEFDAPYVYQDVNRAIQHVHGSGLAHRGILSDPQRYQVKDVRDDDLCSNICIICFYCLRSPVLNSFSESVATLSQDAKGKWEETFLVDQLSVLFCGWRDALYVRGFADPNSTLYSRVLNPREGSSMFASGQDSLGERDSWRELFDVVIAKANKPEFYTSENLFRCYDEEKDTLAFSKVDSFLPDRVYYHGCLKFFLQITKRNGPEAKFHIIQGLLGKLHATVTNSQRSEDFRSLLWELNEERQKA